MVSSPHPPPHTHPAPIWFCCDTMYQDAQQEEEAGSGALGPRPALSPAFWAVSTSRVCRPSTQAGLWFWRCWFCLLSRNGAQIKAIRRGSAHKEKLKVNLRFCQFPIRYFRDEGQCILMLLIFWKLSAHRSLHALIRWIKFFKLQMISSLFNLGWWPEQIHWLILFT